VPKNKADLLQGTLDMLILKSLSLGELHGYGVIQRIRQLSDEMLNVEQGSLYPALYRIEQKGWVSARWDVHETGREAKFYKLTRAGRKQLESEEASWDRLCLAIEKAIQARKQYDEVVQYSSRSNQGFAAARRGYQRYRS
jgi:PadR family transcriptional regulator, regulatory protein PadR